MPITPKTGSLFHAETQREREWVKRVFREQPAKRDPACHACTLQHDELRGAHEGSDRVKNAMMKSELFFILSFELQNGVDILRRTFQWCRCRHIQLAIWS